MTNNLQQFNLPVTSEAPLITRDTWTPISSVEEQNRKLSKLSFKKNTSKYIFKLIVFFIKILTIMPSTRSQHPDLLNGPDWITRRTRGRGKNAPIREGHGAPRGTQSGDELSSSRPKSVLYNYHPDFNLKADLLKLSSSRRNYVHQGASGCPVELQSCDRRSQGNQGLLERRDVPESSTSSMELSSQRGKEQRESHVTHRKLGYSQGSQGVYQQQKTLSESYITMNNKKDFITNHKDSPGEKQQEAKGRRGQLFNLLQQPAGHLQKLPGHLSQGNEDDQRDEKLGPSMPQEIQSNSRGCQIGQTNSNELGLGKELGQEE